MKIRAPICELPSHQLESARCNSAISNSVYYDESAAAAEDTMSLEVVAATLLSFTLTGAHESASASECLYPGRFCISASTSASIWLHQASLPDGCFAVNIIDFRGA